MTVIITIAGVIVIPALVSTIAFLIARKVGGGWTELRAAIYAVGTLAVELCVACVYMGFGGIGIGILAMFGGLILILDYLDFACQFPHWGWRK